jgi:hypothetical protein
MSFLLAICVKELCLRNIRFVPARWEARRSTMQD